MKKILSLVLAGVMVLSLAACGAKKEEAPAASSAPAASDPATPADPNKPLAMGDTANPVTLSIVIKDRSPENADDAAWIATLNQKLLEAGIGAQLELLAMQSGSYATNLGLMLSGGTIPDLIWFQGGDEEFALTQGILADLTSYIDNSVYMKGVMEDYMLERIANYPYLVYLSPASVKVPVMRSDVLDSLACKDEFLADPSVENYYKMFQELKAQGFNAARTVPGNLTEIDNTFDQAFGLTTTWVEQDGAYVYNAVSNGAMDKMDFYA